MITGFLAIWQTNMTLKCFNRGIRIEELEKIRPFAGLTFSVFQQWDSIQWKWIRFLHTRSTFGIRVFAENLYNTRSPFSHVCHTR